MRKPNEKYIVDRSGRKTAVMLDVAAYRALMEYVEDLEDALELDEAVRSAKSFRSYDEIRQELKTEGKL
jgi:hypothetical protein